MIYYYFFIYYFVSDNIKFFNTSRIEQNNLKAKYGKMAE